MLDRSLCAFLCLCVHAGLVVGGSLAIRTKKQAAGLLGVRGQPCLVCGHQEPRLLPDTAQMGLKGGHWSHITLVKICISPVVGMMSFLLSVQL